MKRKRRYAGGSLRGRGAPSKRRRLPPSTKFRGVRGLAWFVPEQWCRLREVSADGAVLGGDYASWLKQAELAHQSLKGYGVTIEKVFVDVDELTAWCTASRRAVDAGSREAFVAELLRTGKAQILA